MIIRNHDFDILKTSSRKNNSMRKHLSLFSLQEYVHACAHTHTHTHIHTPSMCAQTNACPPQINIIHKWPIQNAYNGNITMQNTMSNLSPFVHFAHIHTSYLTQTDTTTPCNNSQPKPSVHTRHIVLTHNSQQLPTMLLRQAAQRETRIVLHKNLLKGSHQHNQSQQLFCTVVKAKIPVNVSAHFFFIFCIPSYISGVHHFLVRFLRMWLLC